MTGASAIYVGDVVHKRLRPRDHALSYKVFALLLDLDEIAALGRRLRMFSYNRFNLLSFHDRDHGPGDGTPAADHARSILRNAGYRTDGSRIMLLCYPRVLGYVFNPLSVFYAFGDDGRLMAVVYEVNNTFGERTSYVIGVEDPAAAVHAQACAKAMFVSPFASGQGRYGFRVTSPDQTLVLAVLLRDEDGPLVKTLFKAQRASLDDRTLLRLFVRIPLLTFKVMGAIHLEAAKLWLKGIPLIRGHRSPRYSIRTVHPTRQGSQ